MKIVKPSEILEKANDSTTINRYHNGYMVECNGRTKDGDYKYLKLVTETLDDVFDIMEDYNTLPLDD